MYDQPHTLFLDQMDIACTMVFNIDFHTSLTMSSFKALYRYEPPQADFPTKVSYYVASVLDYLKHRATLIDIVKEGLHKAQERIKWYIDKKRTNQQFVVVIGSTSNYNHIDKPLWPFKRTLSSLPSTMDLFKSSQGYVKFHISCYYPRVQKSTQSFIFPS